MRRIATVGALFSVIVILMLIYIQDGSEERQGFTAYRLIAHAAGKISRIRMHMRRWSLIISRAPGYSRSTLC